MSVEYIYKCDHCGTNVSPYVGKQWRAVLFTVGPNMPNIHACSKEHMGLSLAKAFGTPIDAKAADLFVEHAKSESRRLFLEAEVKCLEAKTTANEVGNAERMQYKTTIRQQQERIAEIEKDGEEKAVVAHAYIVSLEKRLTEMAVPPTVNGKTPGQVGYAKYAGLMGINQDLAECGVIIATCWEHAANAVLRAFSTQAGQTPSTSTVEALQDVRACVQRNAHDHEEVLAFIDDKLAKIKGIERDTNGSANPHDGCLDCNGTGWSGGNVRNGACDIPLKAKQ